MKEERIARKRVYDQTKTATAQLQHLCNERQLIYEQGGSLEKLSEMNGEIFETDIELENLKEIYFALLNKMSQT